MKAIIYLVSVILLVSICSCGNQNEQMKASVDSLRIKLDNAYKPGFGEFMSGIQVHHAKLWFAGQNENWDLAQFEVSEIKETLENIQKYQKERKESQMVIMLNPVLDSVETSIKNKNLLVFRDKFTSLTNTCNTCHRLVNYGFNEVKIPDTPPFSNQKFKSENK
jgi:hypothetical protein